MIVPVYGLPYHNFQIPAIEDHVVIIKERENLYDEKAIAVYNTTGEKLGYIGKRNKFNEKVYAKMLKEQFYGKVWAIFKRQILIEIEFNK